MFCRRMQVYIHVLILRKQFGHMICRFYLNNPTQEDKWDGP